MRARTCSHGFCVGACKHAAVTLTLAKAAQGLVWIVRNGGGQWKEVACQHRTRIDSVSGSGSGVCNVPASASSLVVSDHSRAATKKWWLPFLITCGCLVPKPLDRSGDRSAEVAKDVTRARGCRSDQIRSSFAARHRRSPQPGLYRGPAVRVGTHVMVYDE